MRSMHLFNTRSPCQLQTFSRRPPPCIHRSVPRSFTVLPKASSGKDNESEPGEGDRERALRSVSRAWSELNTPQRIYVVFAGGTFLIAAAKLLFFVVITVERLFVGGLLFVEALLQLAIRGTWLLAAGALAAVGVYLFAAKNRQKSS